jgi:hypothetical protein
LLRINSAKNLGGVGQGREIERDFNPPAHHCLLEEPKDANRAIEAFSNDSGIRFDYS